MIGVMIGAAVAVAIIGLLIGFTAWLRFLDDDAERSRDNKHRCHHKWHH